ncbi:uncharacterized protein LOC123214596 isoform X2 [Mangifera indica]|uniref:uncharacterized protein LOC123214596 isoform X2 n=1 Tax=Mangifera indica TaxID=29780 RepID=UPI001CF9AD74|nr:uncharacterized protein LOC123214596 isoform X2 [Mangifera indica]
MMRRQQQLQQDQQSRVFYELSALVLNILRSPPSPIPYSDQSSTVIVSSTRSSSLTQITPAGFASLMLGISLALMLCGSVTFFIGFMLMPWVFGLVMVLYIAGIVSTILVLGKSIISYAMPPPSSPRKDIPEITRSKGSSWLLMKLHGTIEKKKGLSSFVDDVKRKIGSLNCYLMKSRFKRTVPSWKLF